MTDIRSQIAARIAELGITQAELARRSGLTQPQISRYLAGEKDLTTASLEKLAAALGWSVFCAPSSAHRARGGATRSATSPPPRASASAAA